MIDRLFSYLREKYAIVLPLTILALLVLVELIRRRTPAAAAVVPQPIPLPVLPSFTVPNFNFDFPDFPLPVVPGQQIPIPTVPQSPYIPSPLVPYVKPIENNKIPAAPRPVLPILIPKPKTPANGPTLPGTQPVPGLPVN